RVRVEAPPPDVIDVVSANAWGLPAPLAPQRARRMQLLAQWTRGLEADVIGLQEMWAGAVPLTPLALVQSGEAWDDGLAFHSRHALDHVEARPFAQARSFDALKTKGVLRTRMVREQGPPVWLYVTHLQSGHGAANARVREQQAASLLAWLDEDAGPAVVLGDFNVDWQDPEDRPLIDHLAAAGLVDVAGALGDAAPTYPGDAHRYDRIYLRSGGGWTLVPEAVEVVQFSGGAATSSPRPFSDHLPVRARIRLVAAND
ncbi:MAG TPA: endonuclease/exonuclease/phosphatase family protein, partial [Myxococcota bacterium]|nr:endonuclease/exonuclease/phosphatase family protein [Myxococcota bacterium]